MLEVVDLGVRYGPVDAVSVLPKGSSKGDDEGKVGVDSVRAKECPDCQSLMAINASSCTVCGHEWPHVEKPKHEAHAGAFGIVARSGIG